MLGPPPSGGGPWGGEPGGDFARSRSAQRLPGLARALSRGPEGGGPVGKKNHETMISGKFPPKIPYWEVL